MYTWLAISGQVRPEMLLVLEDARGSAVTSSRAAIPDTACARSSGNPEAVVRAAAIFALTSETFEGVRERQVAAIEADGDPLVRELFASRPRIDHPLLSPGESPCRVCDEPWHHSYPHCMACGNDQW